MTPVNQMVSNVKTIIDPKIVEKVIRPLTLKFEYIITIIKESKDLSTMIENEFMGSIHVHEQ